MRTRRQKCKRRCTRRRQHIHKQRGAGFWNFWTPKEDDICSSNQNNISSTNDYDINVIKDCCLKKKYYFFGDTIYKPFFTNEKQLTLCGKAYNSVIKSPLDKTQINTQRYQTRRDLQDKLRNKREREFSQKNFTDGEKQQYNIVQQPIVQKLPVKWTANKGVVYTI